MIREIEIREKLEELLSDELDLEDFESWWRRKNAAAPWHEAEAPPGSRASQDFNRTRGYTGGD